MISIDVGYGNVKVYCKGKAVSFPSIYKHCRDERYIPSNKDDMLLELEGTSYHVGMTALHKNGESVFDKTDFLRHKIFVLTAICRSVEGDYEGEVALGLPVGDMKALTPMLHKLEGTHQVKYNGLSKTISITKVNVFAQSEAVKDLLAKADDSVNEEIIGIIDIGQKTVDFVWFENGSYVDERSDSINFGVYNAYTEISKSLVTNVDLSIEPYKVRAALEREKKRAEKSDGSKKVLRDAKRAFEDLAISIRSRLNGRQWNFGELDRLYLIGGGAYQLAEYFEDAPLVEFDHPEFANARAFYEGVTK